MDALTNASTRWVAIVALAASVTNWLQTGNLVNVSIKRFTYIFFLHKSEFYLILFLIFQLLAVAQFRL